jgi:hypothetical protein
MSWKVIWEPNAERRLTEIWLADRSRNRITEATDEIDAMLAFDPLAAGESRSGVDRIVFAAPLAAWVEVQADKHEVSVLVVWRY